MYKYVHFIIVKAKGWKQFKCPPIGDWLSKLWPILAMEYNKVIKKNELDRSVKCFINYTEFSLK